LKWRVVPSPRFSGAWLGAIDAVARNDAWVVRYTNTGAFGPVMFEHWNGSRWRLGRLGVQAFGPPSVSGSSSRDVWIVGTTPEFEPWTLHYDGHGWSSVPAPAEPNEVDVLDDVLSLAPDDAWAVGASYGRGTGTQQALVLHWDGIRWSRVAAPAGLINLSGLAAVAANDIWATAFALEPDQTSGPTTIVAHWDGASWQKVDTKLQDADLIRVRAVSASNVWAAGSTAGTARRGVIVHWDGHAFRRVHTAPRFGADSYAGLAAAGRQAWAFGFEDIEHWDGQHWHQTHIKGVGFAGADALSPRNVWATGANRGGRGAVVYHYACR
jgi:hypothetical protein